MVKNIFVYVKELYANKTSPSVGQIFTQEKPYIILYFLKMNQFSKIKNKFALCIFFSSIGLQWNVSTQN